MNRKSLLAKISRKMNLGAYTAIVDICKLSEESVTKFTHGFKDEIEAQQIMDFIDIINVPSRTLINHYATKDHTFWERVELMKLRLPESDKLKELKKVVNQNWSKRPRFGIAKILNDGKK